jgi:hypothetical protein
MQYGGYKASYHDKMTDRAIGTITTGHWDTKFNYTFENFFHPFVSELIERLNKKSLADVMDATWQDSLEQTFFPTFYPSAGDNLVSIQSFDKEIDVSVGGAYAVYNWELFFHIPLTIAVHLSKTQRFAEAQRWFHYIFDPRCSDTNVWKFLAFRKPDDSKRIEDIMRLLSTPRNDLSPADQAAQDQIMEGYTKILTNPFMPHAVARTRQLAYQYNVVMKYLDNLIAWGDFLFQQDTLESINEATQRYVLAANVLGERPQRVPPRGMTRVRTFAQLKSEGLGPIGNALVDLEGQFPFNLSAPDSGVSNGDASANAGVLFGIGRTLYFCTPRNDKLLGYWDTVADRLFKIRHCMNIQGVVRPLALFDPPLDPGMLVKAAAAGIDIGSIVSGLNQPIGPARCMTLIQKALELCSEVRNLGGALLAAMEKGDSEHMALLRQGHETKIQQMTQDVRFLQWKAAQDATQLLLNSRSMVMERFRYYQRLLGLPADQNATETVAFDRRELTEENFDEAHSALVGQYDKAVGVQNLPALRIAGGASPAQQSGASGAGRLFLNVNEDTELNSHLPRARDYRLAASVADTLSSVLTFIPEFNINLHFWGVGGSSKVAGGSKLSDASKIAAEIARTVAGWEQDQAGMASRTAGFERRADEWLLQYNLAARELMQNGRQILSSLVGEQIAYHEYKNIQQQIENSQEVDQYLHDKFSNEELYLWMQGEISRLYYEYYRFAFDTARKAERTMKQELMRPELDGQDFVKFNYWDGGRKGLLSGEALHLDVKRMEMAYHENNKRELELTRHVSLRQLNPLALLTLKATGSCTVTIPEWLYDLDCPGNYMRRIKNIAVSIPSVVGPYTSINCTLTLLQSSVRKSPVPLDGEYLRQGEEDERFVDYSAPAQSIVTSSANNDSGMFETNLRDERFFPFEGAGAESTWKIDLPKDYPAFDFSTISDVVLHVRYTARQGVDATKVKTALGDVFQEANQSNLALLFSLRHDFPNEWSKFVNGSADFSATIRRDYFPYFTQGKDITIAGTDLYDGANITKHHVSGDATAWSNASDDLNNQSQFTFAAGPDAPGPTQVLTRTADKDVFLIVRYSVS